MSKVIKVKDLYAALAAQMKKGNGEKVCLLADDDEGNGYHPMYFTLTTMEEFCGGDGPDALRIFNLYGISPEDAYENAVIIG